MVQSLRARPAGAQHPLYQQGCKDTNASAAFRAQAAGAARAGVARRRPPFTRSWRPPQLVRAEQQQQEQQLANDGPELPDLKLPLLMPFTPRNAVQQAMLSYRFEHRFPDGHMLVVSALQPEWLPAVCDLLTESFAESLAATPYKNFLRRQVKAYLQRHIALPPKAVVLMALLLPAGARAAGEQQQQQQEAELVGQPEEEGGLELGDGMAMHPLLSSLASLASSSSGGSSSSDDEAADAVGSGPWGPGSGAELAGCVELSFSASTRSEYFTLTPPKDRPYLCNMAVHPALRGRGYGLVVLRAAEQLVAQLGEREIWLHLRVQDTAAARLYEKAGYVTKQSDSFLVRILGMDQRLLLLKVLDKPAPPPSPQRSQQQEQQQRQQWVPE